MSKIAFSGKQHKGMIAGAILAPALAVSLWLLFPKAKPTHIPPAQISTSASSLDYTNSVSPTNTDSTSSTHLHTISFFEASSFYPAVEAVSKKPLFTLPKPVFGATTPHHLIPSPAIASLFSELKKQHPQTIILLSPNHFQAGSQIFLTSNESYPTPFGNLTTNEKIYQKILSAKNNNTPLFEENHTALGNDHGIGALAPFITYYLPDTTIVPILIRDGSTEKDMQQLTQILAPFISTNTPLITSVDFSHYLPLAEANKKDTITWDAIFHWNLASLIRLNSNDYLDTPTGMATLLNIMKQKGTTMTKNYHDNSGNILHQPKIPSTSYFILTFTK